MTTNRTTYTSPIIMFVTVLFLFELCLRLPYVLYALQSPDLIFTGTLHFFSFFEPSEAIFVGLLLLSMTAFVCMSIAAILGIRIKSDHIALPHFEIPKIFYLVALIFIGASVISIMMLGVGSLLESLSGKRSESGESLVIYVLLKMANFCHIIAVIFYVKVQQDGRLLDRIFFVVATIALILPTIVFSQRAILISFALELLYVQMLFQTFNFRGILRVVGIVIPVLLLVSFLRPGNAAADFTFFQALIVALEKVVTSRYFFDFAKLGTVTLWTFENGWLGPVSIGFMLEPFVPDSIIFYKELGPILSNEVYIYRFKNGITPGALLEGVISFGMIGGVLFFGFLFGIFLRIERRLLTGRNNQRGGLRFFLMLLLLSKFGLLVNSSLGALVFQTVVESVFLCFTFFAMWMSSSVTRQRKHRCQNAQFSR